MPFIVSLILSLLISFGLFVISCEAEDRKHYNIASLLVAISICLPLAVLLIYYGGV